MMNTLYIVPTPIGNLEDMTVRAVRVLKGCVLIAAEDTRHSRKLLDHYAITTPTTSFHEFSPEGKITTLLAALERGDVALISDAGTPGIADPGYELIGAALQQGVRVVVLPGANAAFTALLASGFDPSAWLFLGFPPRREGKLRAFFAALAEYSEVLVFYESPNRVVETLRAARAVLGDRPVCVALEVTKFYEEFQRGTLSAVIDHYTATPPRGEVTVILQGASTRLPPRPAPCLQEKGF